MPFELATLLALVLLGGFVAVDGTSFGQLMFSRPFVTAALAGWIVGDPVHGMMIGVVLEAFHLTVLPVGAARYPEGGPAAVAGGAVYATSDLAPSTLLVTVLVVLLIEWAGGETIRYMRQMNISLVADASAGWRSAKGLERRHAAAIGVDFARGVVIVALGVLALLATHRVITPYWGLGEELPRMALTATVAGLLASTVRFIGWHPWFVAAGAVAGMALLLLSS